LACPKTDNYVIHEMVYLIQIGMYAENCEFLNTVDS